MPKNLRIFLIIFNFIILISSYAFGGELKIASVDKNSRINQCDQNHWWYPAW